MRPYATANPIRYGFVTMLAAAGIAIPVALALALIWGLWLWALFVACLPLLVGNQAYLGAVRWRRDRPPPPLQPGR